ncbi:hypothetical protein TNCV_3068051 [Trichonephila clavipes]|nr:hypothetical protein TNCV_3068051 [Trichonephila clavipes]
MEVTRVEQRDYIKIAILRERNAMECHCELVEVLGNNTLPYRTVSRMPRKFLTQIEIENLMKNLDEENFDDSDSEFEDEFEK